MSGLTGNNILAGSSGQVSGYQIEQSLRFEDGDSAYLSRTPASAGNRKTWTWSGWVKRGNLGISQNIFNSYQINVRGFYFQFTGSDVINIGDYIDNTGWQWQLTTTAVYRDVGSWYHIVLKVDTTQATSSDRVKLYINGEQITSFSTSTYPSLNWDGEVNKTIEHNIGRIFANTWHLDAYLAEVNFIDGQALDASNFGETNEDTNQWVPKKYVGTYGTNGFYLNFSNSASLGADSSGNGNDFTPTNLAATDQVLDSPTNKFATLNPLVPPRASGSFTYSEGNLKVSMGGSGDADCPSTMGASSGKWYAEAYILTGDQSTNTPFLGLVSSKFLDNETIASSSNSCVYYYSGNKRVNGTVSSYGATYNAGDIVGIAFNADDNEVTFYKNNSTQGAISLTADEYVFSSGKSAGTPVLVWNFGQDSSFAGNKTSGAAGSDFYYTPPAGFKALCEDNLSDPSIALPGDHFNTVLYTGDGSASNSITGVGFQPDLSWIKTRNDTQWHMLNDVVRGVNKSINSNATNAEFTDTDRFLSFDADGFTVGADGSVNGSGDTLVSWNWKADNTSGSSNTDGTITSTVSANTTAGFSIVSYTGTGVAGDTMGHGLSQAPEVVIMKKRASNGSDGVRNWAVWHKDLTDGNYLYLSTTNAQFSGRFFGEVGNGTYPYTEPTASLITFGGVNTGAYQEVNYNGDDYIMYCFHSVEGYSKIGSYTGNGSADGTFVYTGFRPAFVLFKRTDSTGVWGMYDNKRPVYNEVNNILQAQSSGSELTYPSDPNVRFDIVSNGFKFRNGSGSQNSSGGTYMYLAFAEIPFKYSNAR